MSVTPPAESGFRDRPLRVDRARNLIERFFNKIRQCRRVATRYDKLAASYPALNGHELQVSVRPCAQDGSQLLPESRCFDPQVQPLVVSVAPYLRRATVRRDAGLVFIDLDRLLADDRDATPH